MIKIGISGQSRSVAISSCCKNDFGRMSDSLIALDKKGVIAIVEEAE